MSIDFATDFSMTKGLTDGERAQWGLASVIIGAALVLAAPMAMIYCLLLWRSEYTNIPVIPAFIGAVVSLAAILGLAGFGVAAGLKGRRLAGDPRPSPLATAGVASGAAAIVLWIVVGIDLLLILATFAAR
ncbi:hypothetical protein [Paludisphaera mucosa]|uniref:DUF4190 domain-containing protein n=1 Tax=Paludisphaera mucosa TaxID=3030827 RepID=A0ABT6FKD1_9BACT|nr:hypothetical protein [Paludisphaera mucosa]MDG3008031.1 hypothetical protein [Paludisphaera mucosa]